MRSRHSVTHAQCPASELFSFQEVFSVHILIIVPNMRALSSQNEFNS
jgi:hypothetical protein